jgi:D-beta-D-heptose 7-phosphate kinase/D-beta-D-heptose 1-phosphate adenosyltransferase
MTLPPMQETFFNVLVIGDSCIDEYRFGSISRLNPEGPAPLLVVDHVTQNYGMASNVAANLRSFGVHVDLKVPPILSKKVRYVDEKTGKHLLRIDQDVYADPYSLDSQFLYDAIVIADYAKGFVTEHLVGELRQRFDGPIFVDTKRTRLQTHDNVFYKINELEFSRLQQIPRNLIVTLGAKGCLYDGKMYAGLKVDTLDVCGAGDVFMAGLVFGYLSLGSVIKAIGLANTAAAISCKHLGTYTLTEQDVHLAQQEALCTF